MIRRPEVDRHRRATQKHVPDRTLVEVPLVLIPLVASLLILTTGAIDSVTVRLLVFLLFACSFILLLRRAGRALALSGFAGSVLIMGFVFWYSYPAFVSLFLPGYPLDPDVYSFSDDVFLVWAVFYLALFLSAAWGVSALVHRPTRAQSNSPKAIRVVDLQRLVALSVIACVLGVMPYLFLGGTPAQVTSAIVESRAISKAWVSSDNLGDALTPILYLASSAMIAGGSLLWLAAGDGRISLRGRLGVAAVALVVTFIVYFDQGTRSLLALIALPSLTFYISVLWRRSRSRAVFAIVTLVAMMIVVLQFQGRYRMESSRATLTEDFFQNWFTLDGSIDFFKETVFALRIVPTYHSHFHESALLQFVASPIPRALWPNKPVSEVVWFYTLLRWNRDILVQAGNTFPGIVGQYYMSWGPLGPAVIGALLGWLTARLDNWSGQVQAQRDRYIAAVGIMLVVWLFLCFRVLSPGYLYPVLAAALIVQLSRKRQPSPVLASGNALRPYATPPASNLIP